MYTNKVTMVKCKIYPVGKKMLRMERERRDTFRKE